MKTLHVHDGSEEVRVEIRGVFNGDQVGEFKQVWESSQSNVFWRRFVVDISGLTGYDREGHGLLHQLNQHGAVFAAATPQSLEFLEEITVGSSTKTTAVGTRRVAERAPANRSRHRAGMPPQEANARYR